MTFGDPQATIQKKQHGTKDNTKLPDLVSQACGSNKVPERPAMSDGSTEKGVEIAALEV